MGVIVTETPERMLCFDRWRSISYTLELCREQEMSMTMMMIITIKMEKVVATQVRVCPRHMRIKIRARP
jgi:hypothetical protein